MLLTSGGGINIICIPTSSVISQPISTTTELGMPSKLIDVFSNSCTKVTNHCSIKPLSPTEAEGLFALTDSSRAHLSVFLPWLDSVKTAEDSRKFILDAEQQLQENNGLQLGVYSDKVLAGVLGVHKINWTNSYATLGYWLGKEFLGQGLMTSATRYLVDRLFVDLEINRVEIHCAFGNLKSRAIPERLHFKREEQIRTECLQGQLVDHYVYAMLREDWLREAENCCN
ncbi:acyl-CoA N-acyltransferase [Basidiobolus meristosporus CBS 931.73]|uniref:Acyl-CoA N-acyltransferase n=1 Tax=Basidiobolus meristosporus CBS 931.73 TaxID=1314790 RepID=A0A1Y1Y5J3_9FUNG|nr:acyl-CoA N-acyltransferase [Basidiobolus meristosporus CBS 931.73]|eukprot:ORX93290.1 acyl-CoA N-acyltransferase [Basidiobolus meristosporus CBS 931.73]